MDFMSDLGKRPAKRMPTRKAGSRTAICVPIDKSKSGSTVNTGKLKIQYDSCGRGKVFDLATGALLCTPEGYGGSSCLIYGGPTTPAAGSDFVEVGKNQIKLKKLPPLPAIPKLSDIGIMLLLKEIWRQFKPVFPADGFGIQEGMMDERDITVSAPGTWVPWTSNLQEQAWIASTKFIGLALPLLHAMYERPKIKELMAKQGGDGPKVDVMKIIYAFCGGVPGNAYLNRKYLYDFIQKEMLSHLDKEISYEQWGIKIISTTPDKLIKEVSVLYQKEREAYNALKTADSQALEQWVKADSAEKAYYDTILALTKDLNEIQKVGLSALARLAVARQMAGNKSFLNGLSAVRKVKEWTEADYPKAYAKALSLGAKIEAATGQLKTSLYNFNKAFEEAKPSGATTKSWYEIWSTSPERTFYPELKTAGLSGLKGLSEMNTGSLLKYAGIALLGYGALKKNWMIAGAGAVAAFIGYRQSAPTAAPAAQQRLALRRLPDGRLVRVRV